MRGIVLTESKAERNSSAIADDLDDLFSTLSLDECLSLIHISEPTRPY